MNWKCLTVTPGRLSVEARRLARRHPPASRAWSPGRQLRHCCEVQESDIHRGPGADPLQRPRAHSATCNSSQPVAEAAGALTEKRSPLRCGRANSAKPGTLTNTRHFHLLRGLGRRSRPGPASFREGGKPSWPTAQGVRSSVARRCSLGGSLKTQCPQTKRGAVQGPNQTLSTRAHAQGWSQKGSCFGGLPHSLLKGLQPSSTLIAPGLQANHDDSPSLLRFRCAAGELGLSCQVVLTLFCPCPLLISTLHAWGQALKEKGNNL